MKQTAILFALVLVGIGACDSLVSDIDGVKSGRLDFDKAATIGDTFDSYKYVQQPGNWTESTERGKKIVTWTANVKAQQPECVQLTRMEHRAYANERINVGTPKPCNITGKIAVAFVVLPDRALEVYGGEAQTHAASLDGKVTDDDDTVDSRGVLFAIYHDELPHKFGIYENSETNQ